MKLLLLALVSCFSISATAANRTDCDFNNLEKDMVHQFGASFDQAHAYRLAIENFVFNLDISQVRFAKGNVYYGDLEMIRKDLVTSFGLTENRAEAIVTSMKMVRLIKDETGIVITGSSCIGN